ncbi:MAG: signal peptide peptidase SppA [Cyclobacteriaceae bacterium]|nr:signal peptide peptidase SppA [Cyclobacteriaceae bacterium]
MNFLKTFFASCLGSLLALFLFFIIGIFLVAGIIGAAMSGGDEPLTTISDNSVLRLELNVPITELEVEDPFEGLPLPGIESGSIGLIQLKQAIDHAASDPKIKGIYLDVSFFMGGYATAREIRESLEEFKATGKWVIAYSEMMSESSYYIASAADKVFLNPEGDLEFNGLSVEIGFFKQLFDKLEIKPEVFRVGDFKSAVEPFLLDKMSDENRLQLNALLGSMYGTLLSDIAASRQREAADLRAIADKALVTNARQARDHGLVDSLMYYDQVEDYLRDKLGLAEDKKITFARYGKYRKSFSTASKSKNEIAVIVADGDILPGEAQPGVIGSETFAEQLRKARKNDNVKAIVLRINSPGGSSLASDVMWREIVLASEEKPVIASMGDYAASGGYYLAMACDTIVTQPNTITGSIGVFSILYDASDFLKNKLGITFDEVRTGQTGDLITFTRPLSVQERNIWQNRTNEIYETFTTKAAQGRGMAVEDIKRIASGRVWSGQQALANGLADVEGGLADALTLAAGQAGVGEDYKVRFYPKPKTLLEMWFDNLEETSSEKAMREKLGTAYPLYREWQQLEKLKGNQARLPFSIKVM